MKKNIILLIFAYSISIHSYAQNQNKGCCFHLPKIKIFSFINRRNPIHKTHVQDSELLTPPTSVENLRVGLGAFFIGDRY